MWTNSPSHHLCFHLDQCFQPVKDSSQTPDWHWVRKSILGSTTSTVHCKVSPSGPTDWEQQRASPLAILSSSVPKWVPRMPKHVLLLQTALVVTLLGLLSGFLLQLFSITFMGLFSHSFLDFIHVHQVTGTPVWKKSCEVPSRWWYTFNNLPTKIWVRLCLSTFRDWECSLPSKVPLFHLSTRDYWGIIPYASLSFHFCGFPWGLIVNKFMLSSTQ